MSRAHATCLVLIATAFFGTLPTRAQDRPKPEAPQTVTLDVDRAPLAQVLRKLCLERGFNFVADPRVLERAGDVCVVMKEVSFEEAIESIGELYDLEVRLRGKIVTVRQKADPLGPPRPLAPPPPAPKADAKPADTKQDARPSEVKPADRPSFDRDPAKPSAPPRSDLFKNEPAPAPTPAAPGAPRLDAPAPAPKQDPSAKPEGLGPPPGSVLGTVLEVGPLSVKLKERAGEAREYFVPDSKKDDLTLRGARITQAIKFLKKGDQCALTYEVDEQHRFVITNIIGGPKRAATPTPIPGEEPQTPR